ncbi:MAG TPA: hypothetical protein VMT30_03170 [Candidatus Saccharimonadia bacterium]|nr:hypothetical protein [Candidatus Saccharimonadia bacterium]
MEASAQPNLNSARHKLERAKILLGEMTNTTQLFYGSRPYDVAIVDNKKTGLREWQVVSVREIPAELQTQAGDVIHNLRTALDHLNYALILSNGVDPGRATEFPIFKDAESYANGVLQKTRGMSSEHIATITGLAPYEGGNNSLWLIHKLDITDKHHFMLSISANHQAVVVDLGAHFRKAFADEPGMEWTQDTPSVQIGLVPDDKVVISEGVVLFSTPSGDTSHDDTQFDIQLAFNVDGIVHSEPLIPTLTRLAECVEDVLAHF